MKLIIIGNGFDLHHGLETSFSKFRDHLINSTDRKDNQLFNDIDSIISSENLNSDLLWNDYERLMGQHFHNGINVSRGELQFYRLTELFAERFYQYLLEESKKKIDLINPAIQKEIENADCILTFNYTQTYNIYVNNNANIDIFHIHGQLNQNNLPIIGYYYRNATIKQSQDYLEKYSGFGFHKPALAMKQNEIDFESQIIDFTKKYKNSFSEIVSIGYSYGESDSHIFSLLDTIVLPQVKISSVPKSGINAIPIINFKIFKYDENEYNRIIGNIKSKLSGQFKRNSTIDITGTGFTPEKKDIITFNPLDY